MHLADGADARRTTTSCSRPGAARTSSATTTSPRHALGLKDLGEALQLRNHVLDCLERGDGDRRRRRAPPAADVLHRRRRSDRRRVRRRARPSSSGSCCPQEYPGARAATRCASCCSKAATGCCRRSSRGCRATRASELERRGVDVRMQRARRGRDRQARPDARRPRDRDRVDDLDRGGASRPSSPPMRPAPHTRAERIKVDALPARARCRRTRTRSATRRPSPDKHGNELPMTSPPAMQEGRYVAKQILGRGNGRPFRYFDKGTLATIGRTCGGRRDRTAALHRLPRLARVARRAPLLPDRLREPAAGDAALVLVLRPLRPARARDHPRRIRPVPST